MYDIIMCSHPMFSRTLPDESYSQEYDAAKQLTNVHWFDIHSSDIIANAVFKNKTDNKKAIYHGWMLPFEQYRRFYNQCLEKDIELINSPEQYIACHHFNGWYNSLERLTPKSTIIEIGLLRTMMDQVRVFMKENNCAVIIKDYVKSLKHNWDDACFIPKDANPLHISKVLATFLAIKNEMNDLQGNLVVRQFVNLKQIGLHNKSKMPLAQEFRTFVMNGKPIFTSKYWDQGSYQEHLPPSEFISKVADKVFAVTHNNLFTIDVAQLDNGDWTCIEVGDGQVSAVPDQEDKLEFFKKLLAR